MFEFVISILIVTTVGVVVWLLTTEPKDNHQHVPVLDANDEAKCSDCGQKLQWSEDGQWV